jgi:hypothetical protein
VNCHQWELGITVASKDVNNAIAEPTATVRFAALPLLSQLQQDGHTAAASSSSSASSAEYRKMADMGNVPVVGAPGTAQGTTPSRPFSRGAGAKRSLLTPQLGTVIYVQPRLAIALPFVGALQRLLPADHAGINFSQAQRLSSDRTCNIHRANSTAAQKELLRYNVVRMWRHTPCISVKCAALAGAPVQLGLVLVRTCRRARLAAATTLCKLPARHRPASHQPACSVVARNMVASAFQLSLYHGHR